MHPEVTDDHASDCPECGMRLVPPVTLRRSTITTSPPRTTCPGRNGQTRSTRARCTGDRPRPARALPHLRDANRLFQPWTRTHRARSTATCCAGSGGAPAVAGRAVHRDVRKFRPARRDLGVGRTDPHHSCGPLGSRAVLRLGGPVGAAPLPNMWTLIGLAVAAYSTPWWPRSRRGLPRNRYRSMASFLSTSKPPPSSAH